MARTVKGQLAFEADARPEMEATVAHLDIDFAAQFRPTAEMFWSRVRKDRVLAVARETLGVEWAHTHRKDKKATLSTAMEPAFAKSDSVPLGVTKEGHAAAHAWAPPGFNAFDTGRVDDGEDAAAGTETPPADRAQADTPEEETAEPANETADDAPAEAPPPAASERRTQDLAGQEAIDAMNTVPVAGGGPSEGRWRERDRHARSAPAWSRFSRQAQRYDRGLGTVWESRETKLQSTVGVV